MLNSRGETLLEEVRKDFVSRGHEVLAVPADVANLEDCKKIVAASIQRFDRIDYLITGVYVGIAFVGLTQNEPGKMIYNGAGEKIPKEDVSIFGLQPISVVAGGIIRMIEQRKFRHTFSFIGKLNAFLNRISPELIQYILTRAFLKKGW